MQVDPVEEWRRLTEHYRQMSDGELEELVFDFADLTEMAQQALSGELRHRGLPQPGSTSPPAASATARAQRAVPLQQDDGDHLRDSEDSEESDGRPVEYTWKTVLCECEDRYQVWQLQEMLQRAGIDSWPQDDGALYPRILVAADQFEEARAVIARPVPQEVIDDSHSGAPEYEMPCCPNCRAEDPVLEASDPVNTWRCEACGRQWSDPAPVGRGEGHEVG